MKLEAILQTPVLFLIFNRPDTTRQVFDAIRKARPARLYVVADGPRDHIAGEAEKCHACRSIISEVDWHCTVQTLFREKNLGCGESLSTGITWFFENEEEGIILEDDCLPSPSFFAYCAELLERYRDDKRIIEIAGNNLEKQEDRDDEYSYHFSNLIYSWGWATWRRAWALHDFRMKHYREITSKKYLQSGYGSHSEHDFYEYVFGKMHEGDKTNQIMTWDFQWQFACLINSGLVIVPNRNLVKNIGLGVDATHTFDPRGVGHDLVLEEIEFPLVHPEFVMAHKQRDQRVFNLVYTPTSFRVKSNLKRIVPGSVLKQLKRIMSR